MCRARKSEISLRLRCNGTCLTNIALPEGRKWSPQEWKDSGAWEQVEENLLASEFKEVLEDVMDFGPPPLLAAKPKVVDMPSGPITIEDRSKQYEHFAWAGGEDTELKPVTKVRLQW